LLVCAGIPLVRSPASPSPLDVHGFVVGARFPESPAVRGEILLQNEQLFKWLIVCFLCFWVRIPGRRNETQFLLWRFSRPQYSGGNGSNGIASERCIRTGLMERRDSSRQAIWAYPKSPLLLLAPMLAAFNFWRRL
jgi:hypothetical protein